MLDPKNYSAAKSTQASNIALALLVAVVVLLAVAPLFISRSLIQDLFSVLTMIALAQCWNLLAGYGGLGQRRPAGLSRPRRVYRLRRRNPVGAQPADCRAAGRRGRHPARYPHVLRGVPPAGRLLCHRHLGDGGDLPAGLCPVEGTRRRHRNLAAVRHRQKHVRRRLDPRDPQHQDLGGTRHRFLLAGAGDRCGHHRRHLPFPVHPRRTGAVGDPRQRAGGGERRGSISAAPN